MYVIKDLRLNKFQPVPVPSPRSIFARVGNRQVVDDGNKQTPSCIEDADLNNLSKLESLHMADMIINKREQFAYDASHTDPLDIERRLL